MYIKLLYAFIGLLLALLVCLPKCIVRFMDWLDNKCIKNAELKSQKKTTDKNIK